MITRDEAKTFIGITDDDEDTNSWVDLFIESAQGECDSATNRQLGYSATREDVLYPFDDRSVLLSNFPVEEVTSIEIYDVDEKDFFDFEGSVSEDVQIGKGGKIVFKGDYTFPKLDVGFPYIRVGYKAGFKSDGTGEVRTPADLKKVMLEMVKLLWLKSPKNQAGDRFGLKSDNINAQTGVGRVFDNPDWSAILERYRIRNIR